MLTNKTFSLHDAIVEVYVRTMNFASIESQIMNAKDHVGPTPCTLL